MCLVVGRRHTTLVTDVIRWCARLLLQDTVCRVTVLATINQSVLSMVVLTVTAV